jgi:hypothetical protein
MTFEKEKSLGTKILEQKYRSEWMNHSKQVFARVS